MPLVQRRKRRAEGEEADSPEASPEPQTQGRRTTGEDVEEDESFGGDGGQTQDASIEEMAKAMVRLALACELARKPIRRQDVGERVLGSNSRAFKTVFAQAQVHLESVFGMKMVELPVREKVTVQQRRAAQKKESQTTKSGATSWILTSTLPSEFHNPIILQPSSAPTSKVEAAYTGIYTVLVAAIRLAGGQLNNDKMERYLQRLQIDDQTPIPEYEKNEKLMKRMEKDGYIARIKESSGTGEDDIYWVVGPRGKIEVGDDGVRGLTSAVYGLKTEEEEDELERKVNRSLGIAPPSEEEMQAAPQQNGESSKRRQNDRSSNARTRGADNQGEEEDSQIEYEDDDE